MSVDLPVLDVSCMWNQCLAASLGTLGFLSSYGRGFVEPPSGQSSRVAVPRGKLLGLLASSWPLDQAGFSVCIPTAGSCPGLRGPLLPQCISPCVSSLMLAWTHCCPSRDVPKPSVGGHSLPPELTPARDGAFSPPTWDIHCQAMHGSCRLHSYDAWCWQSGCGLAQVPGARVWTLGIYQ